MTNINMQKMFPTLNMELLSSLPAGMANSSYLRYFVFSKHERLLCDCTKTPSDTLSTVPLAAAGNMHVHTWYLYSTYLA